MKGLQVGTKIAKTAPQQVRPEQMDTPLIILRDIARIVEIERMDRGEGGWFMEAEIVAAAKKASVAVFGITQADTRDLETITKDPFYTAAEYEAACALSDEWDGWETEFELDDSDLYSHEVLDAWAAHGFDVSDGKGEPLRCLPRFRRQMEAVVKEMLPAAKLSLTGDGRAPEREAAAWGQSLEDQARTFMSKRGK